MRAVPASLAAALVLAATAARAGDETGKHCFGEARPKWLAATTLVGQVNPLGLELQLQAGRCHPLVTVPGPLFDYTNLQYGVAAYLSPVYAMPGAFVSIAPLSVLELRAEVEHVEEWTIGMDGSGYFPLDRYDAPVQTLPAANARAARGDTVNFTATLQAELPLAAGWSLLAVDSASWQHWRLGDAPFYYHVRYDLVLGRRDWLLKNTALVLLNHDLSDRFKVRLGVTEDDTWVRGSGYHQSLLGLLATGVISRWPSSRSELQPFLRIGGYTAHEQRQGELQLLAGVSVAFELPVSSPR